MNKMTLDRFPDDCNLKCALDEIRTNQKQLLQETRFNFYKIYRKAVDKSDKVVDFVFPENLWPENRRILILELLPRFGNMLLTVSNKQSGITSHLNVTCEDNIPDIMHKIRIELWK